MSESRGRRVVRVMIGAFAVVFGLATLVAGGSVVFDVGTARADHGNYVPFVLYFNFLSGFGYLAAGAGTALARRWATHLAAAILVGLALTGIALGVHVLGGGAYETETVVAMTVRLLVWVGITAFNWSTAARRS